MPAFRPTRPRLRLRCTNTPSLSSGLHPIPWNVTDYDDAPGYNGAGGYVTDRDGWWQIEGFISRGTIAVASQPQLVLKINGTVVSSSRGASLTQGQGCQLNDELEILSGALVELYAQFSPTAAVTLNDDARWSMSRIGPKSWNF